MEKNRFNTKEIIEELRGGKTIHIENEQQNVRYKSYFASNQVKCKWIKLSKQKSELGKMGKNMI